MDSDSKKIPISIEKDDIRVNFEQDSTFADDLFSAIDSSGLSLVELSKKTGISESSIVRHRTGQSKPSLEMMVAYCIALRVNIFQAMQLIYKAGYNLFCSDEQKTYFLLIFQSHYFGLTVSQANEFLKKKNIQTLEWYATKKGEKKFVRK